MANRKLNFISNNVKGLQNSTKRIKIFEYLKNKVTSDCFIFLQETHSNKDSEKRWSDEFKGQFFFSHGKTNSCGVAIAYYGSTNISVLTTRTDSEGRIILLDMKYDDKNYILCNIYNPNHEANQVDTLEMLGDFIMGIPQWETKEVIVGGDFNLFLDAELDAKGGRPTLKKRSVAKLISIIERFTLVDIWRVRNQNKRRYTFRQSHQAGYLQRRLDYFFVSNSLQGNICETDIQVAFCTDHSPITLSLKPINNLPRGRSLWKFNNSLLQNDEYLRKMKTAIVETEQQLDSEQIKDDQVRWEYLKFKIRDQTIAFSKVLSANKRKEIFSLERKLLSLEKELEFQESETYINTKKELDNIYDLKAEGIRIRSRCKWYEAGEKSTKFFLNLEKRHAQESFITILYENGELINNNTGIERKMFEFYSNLYQEKSNLLPSCIDNFLQSIDLPKIKEQEKKKS